MQALSQRQPDGPWLKQLLRIAQGDNGGSRRVASVLLSLWSGDSFKCDLQELLYLDGIWLRQILTLIAYLNERGLQLDCLVSQEQMNPILDRYTPGLG